MLYIQFFMPQYVLKKDFLHKIINDRILIHDHQVKIVILL
jgi:hypothetical protein